MRKIEIKKNEDIFTFNEPFANDLLDYRIESGELREALLVLQEAAEPFLKLKPDELDSTKQTDMNKILVKINLSVARINKVNYVFAVKHLHSVESKSFSLEDVQSLKVPIDSLEDILNAFNESLAVEVEAGKK